MSRTLAPKASANKNGGASPTLQLLVRIACCVEHTADKYNPMQINISCLLKARSPFD